MKLHLETERLYMRPFEASDAHSLFLLYNDPEVMRYTGDIPFIGDDDARRFAIDYVTNPQIQYVRLNMGRLAAVRKEDDAFIGWAGFKYHPKEDFIDMGYRLMQPYWGKGYATELAARVLQHGFQDHNMHEIIAHVHEDNIGSQRVVEKIGMQLAHKFLWAGKLPARHYVISKATYDNQATKR